MFWTALRYFKAFSQTLWYCPIIRWIRSDYESELAFELAIRPQWSKPTTFQCLSRYSVSSESCPWNIWEYLMNQLRVPCESPESTLWIARETPWNRALDELGSRLEEHLYRRNTINSHSSGRRSAWSIWSNTMSVVTIKCFEIPFWKSNGWNPTVEIQRLKSNGQMLGVCPS